MINKLILQQIRINSKVAIRNFQRSNGFQRLCVS